MIRCRRAALSHGSIGDDSPLQLSTYTISMIFRPDVLPTGSQIMTLLAKGGTASGAVNATTPVQYGIALDYSAGTRIRYFSHRTAGAVNSYATAYTMEANRPYHVVITSNGTVVHVYVGAREYRGIVSPITTLTELGSGYTLPGAALTSTEAIRIGASVTAAGVLCDGFDGAVGEIAIYDAVISQPTLISRLGVRLSGWETNLVAYYPCDDGLGGVGGAVAYDRGPEGPRLTLDLHTANSWGSPAVTEHPRYHPGRTAHLFVRPYQYRWARFSVASTSGFNMSLVNGPTWTSDPTDLHYVSSSHLVQLAFLGMHSWTRSGPCAITASDEIAGYLATALHSPLQARPTRTANEAGTKTWVFDLGYPVPIWGFSAFHNFGMDAGYVEIGTADFLEGVDTQEAPMMNDGIRLGDLSTSVATIHGQETGRDVAVVPDMTFSFGHLRRQHVLTLRDAIRDIGGGGTVFVCPDVKRQLYGGSGYGTLTGLPSDQPFDPAYVRFGMGPFGLSSDRP